MFERLVVDVIVGGLVALLGIAAKWQWPIIKGLFDGESRRQAAQVSGSWEAIEVYSDKIQNTFTMVISCRGGRVSGELKCNDGPDRGRWFDLDGTYKDHILNFEWVPRIRESLESGTTTLRLRNDGRLEGHGLYIEPSDGKVYTSTFEASRS